MKENEKALLEVNVDDLLSTEEIDKLFEDISPEAAKEIGKNYGGPKTRHDEEK